MEKTIDLPASRMRQIDANNDRGSLYLTVFVYDEVSDVVFEAYTAAVTQLTKDFFCEGPAK